MATQRDPKSDLSPRKVADRLKEEGKQRLERGKSTAADQVENVASALKKASGELGGQSTLGDYAGQLAESIGRFGTRLREGSIEDLASDMQAAARRNPGLFVFGGLALGIVLARLIKASSSGSETFEGEYDDLSVRARPSMGGDGGGSEYETPEAGELGTTPPSSSPTFGG
jgi:hypothetical protein